MDTRKGRGKVSRRPRVDIEMMDPTYRTGMLDGYGRAIQAMPQRVKDQILERVVTSGRRSSPG
jgi:hypothetical protein